MSIKRGTVCDVYPDEMAVRVTYPDQDNMVSAKIPVGARSGKNKSYAMYDVGDNVMIAELDGCEGEAAILCAYYSDTEKPKENNQDLQKLEFPNGDFFSYNRATGDLTIKVSGNIKINGAKIDLNT